MHIFNQNIIFSIFLFPLLKTCLMSFNVRSKYSLVTSLLKILQFQFQPLPIPTTHNPTAHYPTPLENDSKSLITRLDLLFYTVRNVVWMTFHDNKQVLQVQQRGTKKWRHAYSRTYPYEALICVFSKTQTLFLCKTSDKKTMMVILQDMSFEANFADTG